MATSGTYVIYKAEHDDVLLYVGVTGKGIPRRRSDHFQAARKNSRLPFHCAIRKYGEDSIVFSEAAIFEDEDLAYIYEEEAIAKYRPRHNVARGGRGGWRTGDTHTPETRIKLSAAATGRPGYWNGKKRSAETVEKMRLNARPARHWLGKKRPPEQMRALHEAGTASVVSVYQELTTGAVFVGAQSAADHFSVRRSVIYKSAALSRATASGLIFKKVG